MDIGKSYKKNCPELSNNKKPIVTIHLNIIKT